MLAAVDPGDAAHAATWHRRGRIRFGIALVIMAAASVVTDAMTVPVIWVLLGAVVAVTVIMAGATISGLATRRWTLLLWPVATCSTLSALHAVSGATAALLVGLIVLVFQFIGITQPRGYGLWFLFPAALLWVQLTDLTAKQDAVRLPIAMLVWSVVSEVPARLIGQMRANQRALEDLAATDSLTGLRNRSQLDQHLRSVDESGAVAIIDLDRFKEYNDTNGHIAGDVVLVDFAETLKANTRPADGVYRYGGDEFLVTFPRTSSAKAAVILDRCADAWSTHDSGLGFCAGIASGGVTAVGRADALLYRAKREGRACILNSARAAAL